MDDPKTSQKLMAEAKEASATKIRSMRSTPTCAEGREAVEPLMGLVVGEVAGPFRVSSPGDCDIAPEDALPDVGPHDPDLDRKFGYGG